MTTPSFSQRGVLPLYAIVASSCKLGIFTFHNGSTHKLHNFRIVDSWGGLPRPSGILRSQEFRNLSQERPPWRKRFIHENCSGSFLKT